MSKANLSFIALIVVGFLIWKVLDYLALPNTISILLIIFIIFSGCLWCYHRFSVLPKRARQVARQEQRSGKKLSEEEIAKIEPISESALMVASIFPVLSVVFVLRSFIFEPFQIPSVSMEPTLRVGDFLIVNKYAYGIKDPIWQNTLIENGKPQRGDIVVFKAPPTPSLDYIKRVIGVGGDVVRYDESTRQLSIIYGQNGKPCVENCEVNVFSYSEAKPNDEFQFLLGQNPDGSYKYGPAPLETIESGSVAHRIHLYPEVLSESFAYRGYERQYNSVTEWVVPEGEYFVMGDNRNNSLDSRYWGFVADKHIVGKATYIWLSLDKKQGEYPTGLRTERIFTSLQ